MSGGPRVGHRRRLRSIAEPPYEVLIRQPVRVGRLRIAGTRPVERHLAISALIVLFLVMGSLLLSDLWRRGDLLDISNTGGRWSFLPRALLPVTLVALLAGWVAFLWGAMLAAWPARIAATALFLIVNASIGRPETFGLGDTLVDRVAPAIGWSGYLGTAGIGLVGGLLGARRSWYRRVRPVLLVLLTLSLVAFFGALLWIASQPPPQGFQSSTLLGLHGAIERTSNMLVPMVLLSAVAIVDFGYALGQAVVSPAWELRVTVVKAGASILLGLKLWIQLVEGGEWDRWGQLLAASPELVAAPAATLLFFGVVAVAWRRRLRRRASGAQLTEAKETLMYSGVLAESLALFVLLVLLGAADVAFSQANSMWVFDFTAAAARFTARHSLVVRAIPWGVLLAVGLWLLVRPRANERVREIGLGLVLLGGYNLPFFVLAAIGIRVELSFELMDVMLSLGLLGALLVRWRRIDLAESIAIAGLAVFAWALFSRGDFVGVLSETALGFLPLSGAVVVVFGLVWALLADSAAASEDSPRFPRESRVLLYVGYLVLSATILNWLEITHPVESLFERILRNGFADIGIPLAAWLIIRRPRTLAEASVAALPGEEAAFDLAGDVEERDGPADGPGEGR